jgi:predicted P-loop ATPase
MTALECMADALGYRIASNNEETLNSSKTLRYMRHEAEDAIYIFNENNFAVAILKKEDGIEQKTSTKAILTKLTNALEGVCE